MKGFHLAHVKTTSNLFFSAAVFAAEAWEEITA